MLTKEDIKAKVELSDGNRLRAEVLSVSEEYSYAFYVKKDGVIIEKFWYTDSPFMTYWLSEPGNYTMVAYLKNPEGEVVYWESEIIAFEGVKYEPIIVNTGKQHFQWVKNIGEVLCELWDNRKRMFRIAAYDYSVLGKDSYLGKVWNILGPLIQIGAYWLVFGLGIYGGADRADGVPYLAWMLCGIIPWFFVNNCITRGAGSVFSKASIALRLKYPLSTIPAGAILVEVLNFGAMLVILVVTLFAYGYFPNFYWLNLIYYMLYAYVALTLLALITSTLTMIARDFQLLINSLMRMLFFMTPILWATDKLPDIIQKIIKLNPVLYIVDGFRDSLIYQTNFWERPSRLLVFWGLNVILLVVGCNFQKRYKNQFLDLL